MLWDRGSAVDLLTASFAALVWLSASSCMLIGSPGSGAQSQSPAPAKTTDMVVLADGDYLEACRAKGVPVPPDWKPSSSEWQSHGNLTTILLTPNTAEEVHADQTTFGSVWSYAPLQEKGACIALGRNGGVFQIICQSASTGYACFWSNDPTSETRWTPETTEVRIASLRDPVQGFARGAVACTECHRGNNAFLVAPDDPTWATVLRPKQRRPTFTTRVEQSSQHGRFLFGSPTTTTYPRYIPIGGKAVPLNNPLPTIPGCSGACHEAHYAILEKNHTAEGYVRIPRPMGPNCIRDSPPEDPTGNCYQR